MHAGVVLSMNDFFKKMSNDKNENYLNLTAHRKGKNSLVIHGKVDSNAM